MTIRGVRGAATVAGDQADLILEATRGLLLAIAAANPSLKPQDIASVLFTMTEDLSSAFPAQAARQIGWSDVPLMCAREISVPESLPRVVRVLIHWNTDLPSNQIKHVYLGEAVKLRPDLTPCPAGEAS
jgi:chorismate mutase